MNITRIIDEIEQLVEASKGVLGKRMVSEEEFFRKMQQMRTALPKALKEAEDKALANQLSSEVSASLHEVVLQARRLSKTERLNLISQLSADLAREVN